MIFIIPTGKDIFRVIALYGGLYLSCALTMVDAFLTSPATAT